MKILAFDTSSNACSVALLMDDQIKSLHEIAPIQQAKLILPMIKKILKDANLKLSMLDAIAFGCGPGSFTGVRIAASVAQGLSFSSSVPLIKISSLATLAFTVHQDLGWNKILVAVDARMQEVYWGKYIIDEHQHIELVGEEQVVSPINVIGPIDNNWNAAGNAWEIYSKELTEKLTFIPTFIDTNQLPNACSLALLAQQKFLKKEFSDIDEALPTYLRDNVAKKMVERL